jgi:hypothetical protein
MLKVVNRRYTVETRGNKFDKFSQVMAYANDVVIMWRRLKKNDGNRNKWKVKFFIVSRKPYNENVSVKLRTCYFEIVEDCTYLGTQF